jgi:glucose-1-phosphate thymidylyltransferase
MKGIILAGGSGTRLFPLTIGQSKQLLPVYDKPMIYYPLSVLMLGGIRDVLIISTENDIINFKRLFANINKIGINIEYEIQKKPNGIAEAFIIGENFIGKDNVCLVLGDNIFYGKKFNELIRKSISYVSSKNKSLIFGYRVKDPERYGVVEYDDTKNVISIEEKPKLPKSNYAVIGLYFYTNCVIKKAKRIKPSKRGELEITTINKCYLNENNLKVEILDNDFTWLDSGTHESLIKSTNIIKKIEEEENIKIACIEEIAYLLGYINLEKLKELTKPFKNNQYGKYLINKYLNEI